jgi:hypothetical protein
MESVFARDLADQDQPIVQALSERPGKPLKLRIQPMILFPRQYRAWKDVRWTLECRDVSEASAVREAMKVFFTVLASRGPAKVLAALAKLEPREDAA